MGLLEIYQYLKIFSWQDRNRKRPTKGVVNNYVVVGGGRNARCDGKTYHGPSLETHRTFFTVSKAFRKSIKKTFHSSPLHGRAIILTCIFEVEYPKKVFVATL